MKQTEQEKADELIENLGDIKSCLRVCNSVIKLTLSKQDKAFYQRVKQILIDKQK